MPSTPTRLHVLRFDYLTRCLVVRLNTKMSSAYGRRAAQLLLQFDIIHQ